MNLSPARTFCYFVCFSAILFFIHLSCSKDVDTLRETVLKEETVLVSEEDSTTTNQIETPEEKPVTIEKDSTEIEEDVEDETIAKNLESRTTVFPVIHDAYLQNGKGYNLSIVRLQENLRTSYLMFDLSPIDSIEGRITGAQVEFVIDTDDGNGKIEVFKGRSNNWTEQNLSVNSAPEIDIPLGYIQQGYKINAKTSIDLNAAELNPEMTTLIFGHTSGDDLAFASKENKRATGSRLIVTYQAPIGAEDIVINEPRNIPETVEEEVMAENDAEAVTEEVNDEENAEEIITEEPTQEEDEEDASVETDEEEPVEEEEVVEEDSSEQETTEEETAQEDDIEQETSDEEPSEDGTTQEEEPTDDEGTQNTDNEQETTTEESVATETQEEEEAAEDETDIEENTNEDSAQEEEEAVQEENGEEETPTSTDQSNSAPITVADATPLKGTVPLEVTFTADNSSDDKAITAYAWNFGDGNSSSTKNPIHTFTEKGSYDVTLETTDEEGLSSTDTIKIIVEAKKNEAPSANASASDLSGSVPLEVDFSGSDSTDDDAITQYFWDFKDGNTSNKENPSHTFDSPGTYEVELSVKDKEGLTDKAVLTITVKEPENKAPVAVASADRLSGEAPLEVNFTGNDSSDDKTIVTYNWNIAGNQSSDANTNYTFNDAGTYDISLTVTDEEGLADTTTLSVQVTEKSQGSSGRGQISCGEGGKQANESGRKIWCWNNIDIPKYSGRSGIPISQEELYIDSECYENQITKDGSRLRFRLNPTGPEVGDWCRGDFNNRAEIRTAPWPVRNPKGTEEWFGWTYKFGNSYKIDESNQWKFFQVHPGPKGEPQQFSLEVIRGSQFKNHDAGEIYVVNACHGTEGRSVDFSPTGITPRAGQTIDIVVHVIYESGSKGLLQVWIEGQKVYDKKVSTILPGNPWGGNAKWGIYKWTWKNQGNVQQSIENGVSQVETYMGTLRMITRKPGDPDYGQDSYSEVAPY